MKILTMFALAIVLAVFLGDVEGQLFKSPIPTPTATFFPTSTRTEPDYPMPPHTPIPTRYEPKATPLPSTPIPTRSEPTPAPKTITPEATRTERIRK